MRTPTRLSLLAAGLCIAGAAPALAFEEDGQAWQQLNMSTALTPDMTANMEIQTRITEDAEHLGQLLLRPSIAFKLRDQVSASLGYAYVMTDVSERRVTHEHRAWQQLAYPIFGAPGSIVVTGRSRMEERTFESRDDTGYRIRQQIRVTAPIADQVGAVFWSEAFYNFNDTDWGARRGMDRWRNFVGLSIPIQEGVTFEPGYLNQYVYRAGEDRADHVVNTTVNVKF